MGLEYFPTFTMNFQPNVGKYSSPMEHIGLNTQRKTMEKAPQRYNAGKRRFRKLGNYCNILGFSGFSHSFFWVVWRGGKRDMPRKGSKKRLFGDAVDTSENQQMT